MRNQRTFSLELKRQVIEELMSGESGATQLCRKYNIFSSLLYHWKELYSRGKFNNEPTEKRALRDRVEKLPAKKGEQRRSCLNTEKAKRDLSFIPEYSLEEGIKETVEWFKAQLRP